VLESFAIEKLELALNKEIEIEKISYVPTQGLILENVAMYDAAGPESSTIRIKKLAFKVDFPKLFATRCLILQAKIDTLKKTDIIASGLLTIESNKCKNIRKPYEDFSLRKINLSGFDISTPFANIEKLTGDIFLGEDRLSSPKLKFDYHKKPHEISFSLKNTRETPELDISLSGSNISGTGSLTLFKDSLKIHSLKVKFFDSSLKGSGQISELDKIPLLALDASLGLELKNLCYINDTLKETCDSLQVEGYVNSAISFRGYPDDPKTWNIDLKGGLAHLKIFNYNLTDISLTATMDKGIIVVPLLSSYLYKGIFQAAFQMDISGRRVPYGINAKLNKLHVHELAQDSDLRNKNIYGLLSAELKLRGYGTDTNTITGNGFINISDANLGPMPLLAPLLGNLYGFMRNKLPGLRSVEISGGSCEFIIRDEQIITDNLWLWGDVLNIYAKGYIDFDKNLNFEVENEFNESEEEAEGWQASLVTIMADFGKFIGKAYLTGTLSKPKWKFEYFSKLQDALQSNVGNFLKGIFQ